jgi:hypothetical protein
VDKSTYIYRFFSPLPKIKKFNLQLQVKVLVSSIFLLIYSFLPIIDPSIPAGEVSNFSQQFQHFTPTAPLNMSFLNYFQKNEISIVKTVLTRIVYSLNLFLFVKIIRNKKEFMKK